MKKKGVAWSWSEVGLWLVVLLIGFVLAMLLLGGTGLFAKAKDAVAGFLYGHIPEEETPKTPETSRIPQEFERYFDNIVSKIKSSGTKDFCWIDIGQMPRTDFAIALYNDKIEIDKRDSRGATPPEKTDIVEGFRPCSVKGEKANRFYECMSKGAKCRDAYEGGNVEISQGTRIAPFLFKFDNSHLCFIYLDGIDFSRGCTNVKDFIDDACAEQIKTTYPSCS